MWKTFIGDFDWNTKTGVEASDHDTKSDLIHYQTGMDLGTPVVPFDFHFPPVKLIPVRSLAWNLGLVIVGIILPGQFRAELNTVNFYMNIKIDFIKYYWKKYKSSGGLIINGQALCTLNNIDNQRSIISFSKALRPTRENLVSHPLAMLSLDNWQYFDPHLYFVIKYSRREQEFN